MQLGIKLKEEHEKSIMYLKLKNLYQNVHIKMYVSYKISNNIKKQLLY